VARAKNNTTPADRSENARWAAHAMHARNDSREVTANARKKFLDKFERDVDPHLQLTPDERARRADHARKAYFGRLAMRSAQARRKKPS